jgi:tetratricopeptide (TPR) repeat protein
MVRDHYLEEAEELDLKAADDFALAIEYDPTRWRAHHNLGIARALVGEVDRAIASFTQALELNPKFADAFFNRAELLAKKQDFNASLADYDRAIELTPDDAGMRTARANLKSSLGDAQGALADFEEAMRLQPESGDAAAAFADACQSAARWKDAATAYQQALKLDPDNPRALQNAAWMMATCPDEYFRNPETALKTAQRAMEASEGPVTAHRLHVLGVAQAAAGDFDSAVASLHEAIQLTSDPILRREIAQHRAMFQRKQAFVQPNPSP